MSWRDVLKDSKQVSRNVGGLDWENESIPEKEEDNCLKQLKEYYDKAKNHPKSIERYKKYRNHFRFSPVPEEVACAVVDRIKSIRKHKLGERQENYHEIDINGTTYLHSIRYGVWAKGEVNEEDFQKFRVTIEKNTVMNKLIEFSTKSYDLDDDIDFR